MNALDGGERKPAAGRPPGGARPEGEAPIHADAPPSADSARRAIEAVWRIESARIIARLARMVRDVGLAEELAQDAFVVALVRWPESGIPDNPGAWLMATAKRRAIDLLRRGKRLERKQELLGLELERQEHTNGEPDEMGLAEGDDLLGLMFIACHPTLSSEARAALTLKLLGGLSTEEIARAFLVPETTIAQRIVRAKRTLTAARVPFEVPHGEELARRLPSVLEAIYLIFNEGYSATAGEAWLRPELCEDALRLGRMLAALAPKEPEVHGFVALMELQASRARARTGPDGEPVLLLQQDRARWDQLLIRRGLAALERAERLSATAGPTSSLSAGRSPIPPWPLAPCAFPGAGRSLGPPWPLAPGAIPGAGSYTLQAEIAACHARARTAGETDWARIVALYDALGVLSPSPVIELNKAVAVGFAFGPSAALAIVDRLAEVAALREYHLLPSVRGDLLAKLARFAEARAEFERAAALTRNARERELLLARAADCARRVAPSR